MAFWGRDKWLYEGKRGYNKCPVLPWDDEKVEAAGYKLSVGREYFTNDSPNSKVQKLEKGEAFIIEPGQFAFILTKEKVYIPKNAIGFISIRASIKFRGLVNVSGFQVNPGFRGNLIFAVFNAGPKHIQIRKDDDLFSLWISDLDSKVEEDYEKNGNIPNDLDCITSNIINNIAGESLTAYEVNKKAKDLEKEIISLNNKMSRLQYAVYKVLIPLIVITPILVFFSRNAIKSFFS